MATEVLRPQDCFAQRTRFSPAIFPRRKIYCSYGNGVPKVNRKSVIKSEQSPVNKRRSPEHRQKSPEKLTVPRRSASAGDLRHKQLQNNSNNINNNNNLVHGKVTILRRGESLGQIVKANSSEKTAIYGTGRLGPDPETMSKQVRVGFRDVYAGSAASMSPSPRALPLPSFFKNVDEKCVDDSATKDLRRLLRLD